MIIQGPGHKPGLQCRPAGAHQTVTSTPSRSSAGSESCCPGRSSARTRRPMPRQRSSRLRHAAHCRIVLQGSGWVLASTWCRPSRRWPSGRPSSSRLPTRCERRARRRRRGIVQRWLSLSPAARQRRSSARSTARTHSQYHEDWSPLPPTHREGRRPPQPTTRRRSRQARPGWARPATPRRSSARSRSCRRGQRGWPGRQPRPQPERSRTRRQVHSRARSRRPGWVPAPSPGRSSAESRP